jgi:hypothetical protein
VSKWENTIVTALILLSPVGILYGWFFFATRMRPEDSSWRNRISVFSLSLVSLVAASWPIMPGLMPHADWGTGAGVGHQMDWVEAWHKPVLRTLLAAMILSLFGRGRLIIPIVMGGVGIGLFWLVSTMP